MESGLEPAIFARVLSISFSNFSNLIFQLPIFSYSRSPSKKGTSAEQHFAFQIFQNGFPIFKNGFQFFKILHVSQQNFVSGSCKRPPRRAGSSPGLRRGGFYTKLVILVYWWQQCLDKQTIWECGCQVFCKNSTLVSHIDFSYLTSISGVYFLKSGEVTLSSKVLTANPRIDGNSGWLFLAKATISFVISIFLSCFSLSGPV